MKLTLSFETPTKGGAARWLIREEGLPDVLAEILPGQHASTLAHLFRSAPQLLDALAVLVDHAGETYPHFESERGQNDINAAKLAITASRA